LPRDHKTQKVPCARNGAGTQNASGGAPIDRRPPAVNRRAVHVADGRGRGAKPPRRGARRHPRAGGDLSAARLRLRRDGQPARHRPQLHQNRHRHRLQALRRMDRRGGGLRLRSVLRRRGGDRPPGGGADADRLAPRRAQGAGERREARTRARREIAARPPERRTPWPPQAIEKPYTRRARSMC
jgi:hypothetical protein